MGSRRCLAQAAVSMQAQRWVDSQCSCKYLKICMSPWNRIECCLEHSNVAFVLRTFMKRNYIIATITKLADFLNVYSSDTISHFSGKG